MASPFLTPKTRRALVDAVQAVERRSSAEVVIAVRARSASYLHADLIWGLLAAWATLAFLLYADAEFGLMWFLVDPLAVGALAGLISWRVPALRRLLTPPSMRRAWVRRAAQATFYERGVRLTTGRTGLLVFVSLLERAAEVVNDRACEEAVPEALWEAARRDMDAAVRLGGLAVAKRIEALGDLLAPALPVSEDDVNELPDAVVS